MRKKRLYCALSALLCTAILIPCLFAPASAVNGYGQSGLPEIVKVGLKYANSSVDSANLANDADYGFLLGWYDSSDRFNQLGELSNKRITIQVDKTSHVQLGTTYQSFEAAANAANDYSGAFVAYVNGSYVVRVGSYASLADAQSAAGNQPAAPTPSSSSNEKGYSIYNGTNYSTVSSVYVITSDGLSTVTGNAACITAEGEDTASSTASSAPASVSGGSAVGESSTCMTITDTNSGAILFEYDGKGEALAIQPINNVDTPQAWFLGNLYRGGFRYSRSTNYNQGGRIAVTNFVPMEEYVAGVLPYELSADWPMEALKAGAVCARSFAITSHNHQTFDVCNTTDCQVYRGVYTGKSAENITSAERATEGVCAYYNGAPIEAVYCAGTGGYTESALNTWSVDRGYLQAKVDEFDTVDSYPGNFWSYDVTSSQVTSMLRAAGKSCSTIVGMAVTRWTEIGNVLEVSFKDDNGRTFTLTKDDVRLLRNISGVTYMSRRFSITHGASSDLGYATQWNITGSGNGHNVGLSQWGARAMANRGYDYEEILRYYFTGIDIY